MKPYENLDQEGQLKAENAFLQMKLMLENGATSFSRSILNKLTNPPL